MYPFSDSDHDDDSLQNVFDTQSPLGSKRRVTFNSSNLTGTSPLTSSPTKVRRRIRTTSRSIDERISFRGRNPIYTAGIFLFIFNS